MAMRKQIYTWELHGDDTDGRLASSQGYYPPVGTENSILTGHLEMFNLLVKLL